MKTLRKTIVLGIIALLLVYSRAQALDSQLALTNAALVVGLTIHYQLATTGDEAHARKLIQQLRRAALDLSLQSVGDVAEFRGDQCDWQQWQARRLYGPNGGRWRPRPSPKPATSRAKRPEWPALPRCAPPAPTCCPSVALRRRDGR